MAFDAGGWLSTATPMPSPNRDARPDGIAVELVVIHAISRPPGQFGGKYVADLFLNRLDPSAHSYFGQIHELRVSAHFLIDRQGAMTQFVGCDARAWHAGVSSWRGRARCNDYSIGIELEGCDELPFSEPQYEALTELLGQLLGRYPSLSIVGHADIAPGRKSDPGPCFNWSRVSGTPA
jgi:N-acetyl-anhydromuramoyl-L-alanine amidase